MKATVSELEYSVFERNDKMNVFEKLEQRIIESDCTRLVEDKKLEHMVETIEGKVRDISFENAQLKKQFEQVMEFKMQLLKEFGDVKDQNEKSKEEFMQRVKKQHREMLASYDEVKKFQNEQEHAVSLIKSSMFSNKNFIQELQVRSEHMANNVEKLQRELTILYELK
mmetsp:Transcript_681/g.732  ORF Transcript_681/g.732 Transcript_681/m.732 type:complete len:168 (+) Transcript_681:435-938(+)